MRKIILLIALIVFILAFPSLTGEVKADSGDNVSGWAWSENIGWISFNCDNNYNGISESHCPGSDSYPSDYGVQVDLTTGDFSGYAWSENIGWISFDREKTGNPPADPFQVGPGPIAKIDLAEGAVCGEGNQACGWARALAACKNNFWDDINKKCTNSGAGDVAGGWDGWIKLQHNLSANAGETIWPQSFNPSLNTDVPWGVAVDGTDLYVVGYDNGSWPGPDSWWRIEKIDRDTGSRLWPDGITFNLSDGSDVAMEVAVDNNGLYVVGSKNGQWHIKKLNKDTGADLWSQTLTSATARAVAVDSTGLYVAGSDGYIEKRDINNLDNPPLWSQTIPVTVYDVAIDSSGLYVVGYDTVPGDQQWHIEKLSLTDGTRLWLPPKTFNLSTGFDWPWKVVVDSTGLYVAGAETDPATSGWLWHIEKLSLTDGSRLWLPSGITYDAGGGGGMDMEEVHGMAVDRTGLYLVGDLAVGRWLVEKRDLSTGKEILWSRIIDPSTWAEEPSDMALDSTGLYVIGEKRFTGMDKGWHIEKLYHTAMADYGTWLNTTPDPDEFMGWAWGSDVVGWISFNCLNQGCGPSDYKVTLTGPVNQPPSASNLSLNEGDYCLAPLRPTFSWDYSDPEVRDQDRYQVQVDDDSEFTSVAWDSCNNFLINTCDGPSTGDISSGSPASHSLPAGSGLSYNTTYYWRVRVWDVDGVSSGWVQYPGTFTTPLHGYPDPDFSHSPLNPSVGDEVTFTDFSICYNSAQNPYDCDTNPLNTYLWDFGDGGPTCSGPPTTVGDCGTGDEYNPTHIYSSEEFFTVTLSITDDLGNTCYTTGDSPIATIPPLPEWKEVAPTGWLSFSKFVFQNLKADKLFASISNFF